MSNMSYCRHENTAQDLADVIENWNEYDSSDASRQETAGRKSIIRHSIELIMALHEADLLPADLNDWDGSITDEMISESISIDY